MGCCGSGSKKSAAKSSGAAKSAKMDLPGKTGMVILEYIGQNWGDETWRGPVTPTIYVLGGVKRKGYVDKRDAYGEGRIQGMLAIREKDRPVFREVKPKKANKPKPKVEIVEVAVQTKDDIVTINKSDGIDAGEAKEAAEILKQRQVEQQQRTEKTVGGIDLSYPDPSKMTVKELNEAILGLDLYQLENVLNAELKGRGRTTAIKAIKEAISERTA